MKSIKKIIGILITIVGIFSIFNIDTDAAGTFNSSLSSNVSKVQPGATITLSLKISGVDSAGLGAISYVIDYDESLVQFSSVSDIKLDNGTTLKFTDSNDIGSELNLNYMDLNNYVHNSIITINFTAKSDGVATFSINDALGVDRAGNSVSSINSSSISVTIKTPSDANHLENLTIPNSSQGTLNPGFLESTLNYTVNTKADSITLRAKPTDGARISSSGWSCDSVGRCDYTRNNLQYGSNKIVIQVTSESNKTKTYTVNVVKEDNREKDPSLNSISGVKNFKKTTYVYDVTLPTTQGTFTVDAEAVGTKSKINYSIGPRLSLNYGETKTIIITVTAENGSVATYTVNVTREDNRSQNNYLKSLTVDKGSITFNKEGYSYRIIVDNDVNSITIGAMAEDKKSRIEGIGKKPLAVGSNLFRITVVAENESKKIYTISVIRKDENNDVSKLSRNTNVKSLTLNGERVNLIQGIYTYALSVENDVSKADFFCELEDPKTMALLEGDRNLKVGVNKFKVTITAENGNNVVYDIVVERKELRKVITNTKEDILNTINNTTESVITVSVPYNDKNRVVDSSILNSLKNTNKTLIYEVLNENRGLHYSVTISGSNLTNISDFNFDLTFSSENKETIDKLSNAKKTVYINLRENATLQGKTSMKLYVGDKFDATNTLTLYYYDKVNNKLELVSDNLKVKNSYIEVEIDKYAEYILMDKKLVNKQSVSIGENTGGGSGIAIIAIVVVVIIAVAIIIIVKKKNTKKIIKPTIPNVNTQTVVTKEEETTNDNRNINNNLGN